ncbi:MAG: biotin/lipoyl-containing protein [Candidatus Binatia bacterium]
MKLRLFHQGNPIDAEITVDGGCRRVKIGDAEHELSPITLQASSGAVTVDGTPVRFLFERSRAKLRVAVRGESFEFDLAPPESSRRAGASKGNPETRSPMPGKVLDISVVPGKEVKPGDPLLILEAMKMENVLSAEVAGTVKEVHVRAGDMVEPGKLLVVIEPTS